MKKQGYVYSSALLTRTSCQDIYNNAKRLRSSQNDLQYRETFTTSSYKLTFQKKFHTSTKAAHLQDKNARTAYGSTGIPQDLPTTTCTRRRSCEDSERISLFNFFLQGPVQDHTMASDCISLGIPQDLLTRTCTELLENFTGMSTRSSHKDHKEL